MKLLTTLQDGNIPAMMLPESVNNGAAKAVAREPFDTEIVLADLLQVVGLL